MTELSTWIQLAVSVATLATLVWGLVRMFASAREAAAARALIVETARKAEIAALYAADEVRRLAALAEAKERPHD